MARLVADKHTEAVVRQANARRVAEAPLLAHAGLVQLETVEDRLALRLRVTEGTFWRYDVGHRSREASTLNRARWYAYLCSLHPAAPAGIYDLIMGTRWGVDFAFHLARRTYARLIAGWPVEDDFEIRPAPYIAVCRKHWARTDGTPEQRRADMEAEIDAWKAAHPGEAEAWEAWRAARDERERSRQINYHDARYTA